MNIGYVFLVVITGMAYFVTGIPTPDEMIADFQAAQKFYTSGAYDQALDAYQEVTEVESRFLNEENVVVEFGELIVPVQEASLYKIGQTYFKMIQEENRKAGESEEDEVKEKARKLSLEYSEKATEYYSLVQERTINQSFKAQAQNQIINTWYEVVDYERVILEGETLIARYSDSPYVLDAMYNIGWAYFDKKDYDKSIETFNSLVNRYPSAGYKTDRALFQIGESYYDQEKYADAIPSYTRLVEKMRINELTDQEIARIQRDKLAGITDETALELAAKSQLKVGACYANIEDYQNATAAYRRVADLFKFDQNLISEAYQRMADMHLDRGDFDSSIQAYRDAIDEVPDRIFSAKMQILIGQRYSDEGRFVDSIREWNHYINAYNDVAFRAGVDVDEAFFRLGRSYYDQGNLMITRKEIEGGRSNLDLSLNSFDRLMKQFPDSEMKERVYFYQALVYHRYGTNENYTKSLEINEQLLKEFSDTPYKIYVYFFKARALQALGDFDKAIAQYQQVIDEYSGDPQIDSAWMEMAMAQKAKGDEENALPGYLKVTRNDPRLFTTARLLASQYLYGLRRYDEVVDVVNFAVEETDAIADVYRLSQLYIMRGNARKNNGDTQESIDDYTLAYNLNEPQTKELAAVYRAGAYIDLGQLSTAESDLKQLMSSEDEGVRRNAQIRLAVISVQQDKTEQAIQTYLDLFNSTEEIEDKLGYLRNLAQLSLLSEDWERVDKFSNMMLDSEDAEDKKVDNQDFYYKEESYFNLALSYEAQGDTLKARDYLEEGFKTFPKSYFSSDMLIKIGTFYLTSGQLRTEAISMGQQAIDISAEKFKDFVNLFPTSPYAEMAHYYLGFCYYNGRRFDEAYDTFSSFANKYTRSEFTPEAIFYYADCQYNLGGMQEAVDGFDIIINKYPKHEKTHEAYYTRAWALMDLQREDEGIASLQALVDNFPESQFSPSSLFSIADYFYNVQRYTESLEAYQRVLDDYPDSEVSEKVPETIKDLKETIAYIEYEKGYNLFVEARESEDKSFYVKAAEIFDSVAVSFPFTEAEIGSYSNLGICYEELEEWSKAVDAYDMVIRRFEEGEQVGLDALTFATAHKQYIVANKF